MHFIAVHVKEAIHEQNASRGLKFLARMWNHEALRLAFSFGHYGLQALIILEFDTI